MAAVFGARGSRVRGSSRGTGGNWQLGSAQMPQNTTGWPIPRAPNPRTAVTLQQPVKPSHPIRQQEMRAVILAAAAVAAIEVIGVAVPLRHRQFVVGQHDQRLAALEAIGERVERNVEPVSSSPTTRPDPSESRAGSGAIRRDRTPSRRSLRRRSRSRADSFRPLDLPAALEAFLVDRQQRGIRFVRSSG